MTSREAKWGRPDRRRGGRNGIASRGYRGKQGHGEQVEGGKKSSAGQAVEAGDNGLLFSQAVQDHNEGGKLVAKSGTDPSKGGGWERESGQGWQMGRIQKTV